MYKKKQGWAEEAIIDVNDWLDEEHLILIAGWTRDGYTFKDIARKIGIGISTFNSWRRKYTQFDDAMRIGREIVDYKVENALLKSAIGYTTKELKVTVLMRLGKVVEKTKETTTKEVAPNVAAIQMWLYNRLPEKWNRRNGNLAEDLSEDESIKIEVTRAKREELNSANKDDNSNPDDDWVSSVNESVKLQKAKDDNEEGKELTFDPDYWPEDDEWEDMKRKKATKAKGKKRSKIKDENNNKGKSVVKGKNE